MTISPFVVNRFAGLNLLSDPEEVGPEAAVSLLNVDTDQRGVLRTRDGYSNFTSGAGANAYKSLYFHPGGQLIGVRAGGTETTEAFSSAGAVLTSSAAFVAGNGGKVRFASIGTPATSTTFIASSANSVLTWDGSAFAAAVFTGGSLYSPTSVPFTLLAAWKERLVSASTASSVVAFSDAGAPTVFSTNNFVQPDPGDGETTIALCGFGDLLFLFRQTKMFVFDGIDTDVDGEPIFVDRRQVFGNIGSFLSYAVAPDGVYVLTSKGLYRTQGGPLVLVSEQPRGIFASVLSRTIPTDYDLLPATAVQNRLYFGAPASGSSSLDRTLVFDIETGDWLVWDIAAQSMTTSRYTAAGSLVTFGVPSKHIAQLDTAVTTDAGTAIAWNWTSGITDLSGENRVTVTLESAVWGTGTVTVQVANDHGSVDTGSALTLGTSPAVAQAYQPIDREGVFWQLKLSGSGPAKVNRVVHYVSFVKPAGIG